MQRSVDTTTYIRAPQSMACDVLRRDPGCLFGEPGTDDQRRSRRFRARLVVRIGSGTAVEQEVDMDLDRPRLDADVITMPLRWHPIGHQRVLPSFDGELVLRPGGTGKTQMSLRGIYVLRLGSIGRFGDGVVGRRVARRSITDLLDRMALNLDAEVDRRLRSMPYRPAPYPPDLRGGSR